MWSHFELSYFRYIVPADAIHELVVKQQPPETQLLRAEIFLTTPSAFVLPQDWQGSADRSERQASLEYIDVQSRHLGEVQRDHAEIHRPGRREARPSAQDWDVQGDGDGGSAVP